MPRKSQRVAYPLTFLLKKEGDQWASLTPEMGVASCGDSMEHAREMLKDAIRATYRTMVKKGWTEHLWEPMTPAEVAQFESDPPGEVVRESFVMLVTAPATGEQPVTRAAIRVEFVPSISPSARHSILAAG
jgi:predicted RNase H-like HicB family nuclease